MVSAGIAAVGVLLALLFLPRASARRQAQREAAAKHADAVVTA